MKISGWIKQSLMDYPGKIAAVVFTQGCNFRCPYCHNPELIPLAPGSFPEELILQHLAKNRFLLDGIVITGGEPTLQKDLCGFIEQVKAMDLAVKLDTNGTHPQLLNDLISKKLIDYVAMDIKSSFEPLRYGLAVGIQIPPGLLERVKTSVRVIIESGIDHEFRTTVCQELVRPADICSVIDGLKGCRHYYLQQYRPFEQDTGTCGTFTAYPEDRIKQLINDLNPGFDILFRN